MKNIYLMTMFTLKEAMARKVFLFFAGISILAIIITVLIFSAVDTQSIIAGIKNNTGNDFLVSNIVSTLEIMIISPLAGLGLLLAIFASSSFVPNMLEKGNIDLLLSKPVSRQQLLWGKYVGGLVVVLLNIGFLVLGIWLIIAIKFSYWDPTFLWVILIVTFTFAVLYSLIVLCGILTKGSMLGMMLAYFIFLILSPVLALANSRADIFFKNDAVKNIVEGIYYLIPKTSELMGSVINDLATGKGISDFQPLISSFLFLVLMMILSMLAFRKKDF
jgi:ABC-type transport system involved in multi-copper enzyme maturation permease subunit